MQYQTNFRFVVVLMGGASASILNWTVSRDVNFTGD